MDKQLTIEELDALLALLQRLIATGTPSVKRVSNSLFNLLSRERYGGEESIKF